MGEMVSFASNGGTAEGYLAGEGPGVVVVQEWWGLNDQIRGTVERFASEGFTALAPDFYRGEKTTEPDEAGKLMMAINVEQAGKDARGAAAFLAERTGGRVGVIGFCMGGQLALLAGTVAPDHVAAVVDMYGIHPAVQPDYTQMRGPVLALFAGKDDLVDADGRAALAKQLSDAGVSHTIDVYPDAGHAFMNETRPEAYNAEAAEDAWRRILAFFGENLSR